MRIKTGIEGQNPLEQTKPQQGVDPRADAKAAQAPADAPDKVSFSEEAKLRSLAMQEAQASDGVRTDRIAALKAQVQDGTYKPDANKIAKGILREELDLFI